MVLAPLPHPWFNGSYFVIIYVALGVVADVSAPLRLRLRLRLWHWLLWLLFCWKPPAASAARQDTFLAVVDLLANLLKIFWLLHFITPDPSEDTQSRGLPVKFFVWGN